MCIYIYIYMYTHVTLGDLARVRGRRGRPASRRQAVGEQAPI